MPTLKPIFSKKDDYAVLDENRKTIGRIYLSKGVSAVRPGFGLTIESRTGQGATGDMPRRLNGQGRIQGKLGDVGAITHIAGLSCEC